MDIVLDKTKIESLPENIKEALTVIIDNISVIPVDVWEYIMKIYAEEYNKDNEEYDKMHKSLSEIESKMLI